MLRIAEKSYSCALTVPSPVHKTHSHIQVLKHTQTHAHKQTNTHTHIHLYTHVVH